MAESRNLEFSRVFSRDPGTVHLQVRGNQQEEVEVEEEEEEEEEIGVWTTK